MTDIKEFLDTVTEENREDLQEEFVKTLSRHDFVKLYRLLYKRYGRNPKKVYKDLLNTIVFSAIRLGKDEVVDDILNHIEDGMYYGVPLKHVSDYSYEAFLQEVKEEADDRKVPFNMNVRSITSVPEDVIDTYQYYLDIQNSPLITEQILKYIKENGFPGWNLMSQFPILDQLAEEIMKLNS